MHLPITMHPMRSRRTDPCTSHVAAQNSKSFSNSHSGRILAALADHGPLAACELMHIIGLTVVQVDRRIIEIFRSGLIEVHKIDGKEATVSGCRVWQLVKKRLAG